MSARQWVDVYGERPVLETLSAFVFDNLFGRFRVLVAEHGASWIPHPHALGQGPRHGAEPSRIGGTLPDRPSRIFREFVRVAPYPEDDVPRVVENLDGGEP